MITSPSASVLKRSGVRVVWESSSTRNSSSESINKPFLHSASPSDPHRQASRLPIKILNMLSARSGHILHPEYLQPLPSTPISPIEVRGRGLSAARRYRYNVRWLFELVPRATMVFGSPMQPSRHIYPLWFLVFNS